MTTAYVFYDQTTSATSAAMAPAQVLPALVAALSAATADDGVYGSVYRSPMTFRVAASADDRQPGERAIHLRDTIPEAPGALAYHQVVDGVPDLEIGVDLFSSLSSGAESLTVGVSHEVFETDRDPGANGYKTRADEVTADAEEVCDYVEGTFFSQDGVDLSNFLLPAAWISGAEGPYDHLGVMTSQTDMSHGYGVVVEVSNAQTEQGFTTAGADAGATDDYAVVVSDAAGPADVPPADEAVTSAEVPQAKAAAPAPPPVAQPVPRQVPMNQPTGASALLKATKAHIAQHLVDRRQLASRRVSVKVGYAMPPKVIARKKLWTSRLQRRLSKAAKQFGPYALSET
jgi:hypothetical protein